MGEAPPPPAAESPLKNTSLGNDSEFGAPEVKCRMVALIGCQAIADRLPPREVYFSHQFLSLILDMGRGGEGGGGCLRGIA